MTPAYTKSSTLLKIDHVSLAFGSRLVLLNVCADIQDIQRPGCVTGQVVCFLGPSGVGKSTLSRIIAGLLPPTSGQVLVDYATAGPPLLAPVRKGAVGMVAQTYPLFEFATVEQNLWIAGRQGGRTASSIHVESDAYCRQFGLREYWNLYPYQLSGGTRQRVAIVRQLMCAGHYLVLDEPFSGLDPVMKQKACALITQVANLDERNTIIIVTHDVAFGMSVADTVWLMGKKPGQQGASILDQYDLAAEDLCWRPDLLHEPKFQARVADVLARFEEVAW